MVEHIKAEIQNMLEVIELRPNAAKYQPERFANDILDMIEGFGMVPQIKVDNVVLKTTDFFKDPNLIYEWEPEDEEPS